MLLEKSHGARSQARQWTVTAGPEHGVVPHGPKPLGPHELLLGEHDARVREQSTPGQEVDQQPEHGGSMRI